MVRHCVGVAVLALLISVAVAEKAILDPICPPYSDLPWYENGNFAPFTWCKSGDVGRVSVSYEMDAPDWAHNVSCSDDGQCQNIIHTELFDLDAQTYSMTAFISDPTKLVLRLTTFLEIPVNATFDVGTPINHFSMISVSVFEPSVNMHGLSTLGALIHAKDGRWFELLFELSEDSSHVRMISLRDFSTLYRSLFGAGVVMGDAVSVIDRFRNEPVYAISLSYHDEHLVSFAQFDYTGLQKPFAYVNLTRATTAPKLTSLQQSVPGANRTLIALSDSKIIHLIRTPEISDISSGSMIASWELDWTNSSAPSAFFSTSGTGNVLKHISLMSELEIREDNTATAVWMATVIDHFDGTSNSSKLTLRMYPEFATIWNAESPNPVLDPLNYGFTRGVPCPWNLEWSDSGHCTSRPSKTIFEHNSVTIPSIAIRNIPNFFWLQNIVPPNSLGSNWTTPSYSALFFIEDSMLFVYGIQPVTTDPILTRIEQMNNFTLLGTGTHLSVSANGLHVFPIVSKPSWELKSINRFAEMCDLANAPNKTDAIKTLLDEFKAPCTSPYRRVAAADFIQYLSMCPIGTYCSTASFLISASVYPGSYAPYPLSMKYCEPGSYCVLGIRRDCPPGFICPLRMQIIPTPCPIDSPAEGKTCWASGLTAPIPAPQGTIPAYAIAAPVPAPPGYYTTHDSQTGFISMAPCTPGEYCPLGRDEREDRNCPPGTFCSLPTNIAPLQCSYSVNDNYCSYCPPGSTSDDPCPAGYYCPAPYLSVACVTPYHCPAGTMAPTLCPPGYYCPTPAEKKICPKNYYCELGTIAPSPCAVLSYCPPGTKNNSANFILALVCILVIGLLVTFWRVLEHRITKQRLERSRQMQDAEKLLARARLQQQQDVSLTTSTALAAYDDEDDQSGDEHDSLLNRGPSPRALAALINHDLNSRMPALPFTVDITFKELGLKIKGTEKKVLDGVTGTIRSGRVTAVMGPSGAGKTTFMSTLANKAHYGDRTGTILLNGQKGDLTSIQKLVGFVPQDDVMLRELSVTEILNFNAKMRLPSELTEDEVNAIVRKSIRLLGLYDIRHELIGDETKRGISGGQRKRVNIGMELVAQPAVLFLDEPTSGLDSSASLDVCAILRRVAEEAGMTVISVIHQPRYDIFTMFHDVLLLGKGGRTVYLGPTKDAVAYFEKLGFSMPTHCNPADFLIDVVAGAVPRQGYPDYVKEDLFTLWIEHQKTQQNEDFATDIETDSEYQDNQDISESSNARAFSSRHSSRRTSEPPIKLITSDQTPAFVLPPEGERKTSSFFHQFWWFFVRSLVQQKRNWISILTDVILVVVSAITFGIVFLDSHYIGPPAEAVCKLMPVEGLQMRCSLPIDDPFPQIALMTTIGLALPASMAALRIFGTERVVFWRESSVGANTAAYYLGKEFGFLPSSILLPLLYAGVFYNFTVPRMNFGLLYLIFLATWWCSTGLSLVVSILVPPNLATISTVVVVFGMSMFSGVRPTLLELKKMWPPFSLISYVSFFRWLTEAYYVAEIWQWRNLYNINTGLKAFNYHLSNFPMCIGLVLGMGLAFRVIALILLEVLHRDQRR